jgi:hypothetical protein
MDVNVKPGRYDTVLAWLEVNPGATIAEITFALEVTRSRAELCLKYGLAHGTVRRWRTVPPGRNPYQWYRENKER